jgi:type I site-specific restriction-modification system R (restriction) subunit
LRRAVLDYIRHFVLFEQDGDAVIKKIALSPVPRRA